MSKDYFSYNTGMSELPVGAIRISPSQFSNFFDKTSQWWAENFFDEDKVFNGSTATELGTCVHAAAAMYFDTGTVDKKAIEEYISSIRNIDIDKMIIFSKWEIMAENLINEFIINNVGTESESFVKAEILPGVYAAGSIDLIDSKRKMIVDYKTMGSLDSARVPVKFARPYYFQQLIYAWILKQNGYEIDYLKLVFVTRDNTGRISEKTGKAMKDYYSEVHELIHVITDDDMIFIESCLKLAAESIKLVQEKPEYQHLICQDMRKKIEQPEEMLFKD